jgi:K+-transporting ATPase A subunit
LKRTFASKVILPWKRLIYRITRIHPENDQLWKIYAGSCLAFSLVNFLMFNAILRRQRYLPMNPERFRTALAMPGSTTMTTDLAFNTAVGFMTNTSWQASRRVDIELPCANGRDLRAELHLRGHGDGNGHRHDPWFCATKPRKAGNFWVDLTPSIV